MMINEFKADLDVKNKQGLTIRDTLAGLKGALFEQDNKERFQELCKLLLAPGTPGPDRVGSNSGTLIKLKKVKA